ncbi:CARDB domain-containing protein [Chloroflexota bacterium]
MDFQGLFKVDNHKRIPCRRLYLRITTFVIIAAFLLLPFSPFSPIVKETLADNFYYDFISEAEHASWSSGAGGLPFPGMASDSRGFALHRSSLFKLEDGSSGSQVLETHPEWVSSGWIMGRYPAMTIPAGAELRITVGFLQGATESDGVTFKVQFEEGQTRQTVLSQVAEYDGELDSVTQSLSSLAGKAGYFILYVEAGQSSGQDWAVWVEAEIMMAATQLPDLVTTEVWEEDGKIQYKIVNEGDGSLVNPDGPTTHFCNALFIDGELVAKDCVNLYEMLPGQWKDNPFDYDWQATQTEHEVKVCADWDGEVDESNENNNCLEETLESEITVTQPPPAYEMCLYSISGTIYNFPYHADTLKIQLCEAETIALNIDGNIQHITECLGGSMVQYVDVSRRMEGDLPGPDLEYYIGRLCPGEYIITPVKNLAADVCEWQGTWQTVKGQVVRIENSSAEGFDFTFTPLDTSSPLITSIHVEPEHPVYEEEATVTVLADDNKEIISIWQKTDILSLDGTVSHDYWHSLTVEPGLEDSTAGAQFPLTVDEVLTATVTVKVCDDGGNSHILSKVITCGNCSDGYQNQGETGVDCGGPCPSHCVECITDHSLGEAPSAYLYSPDDRATVHSAAIDALFEYADKMEMSVLDLDTGDTYATTDNYIRAVAMWIYNHMGYRGDDLNELCLDSVMPLPYEPSEYGHGDFPVPAAYTLRYSGEAYVTDVSKDYFGDCEDFAILASAMLRSLGVCYNCIFNAEHPGHGFNIIYYQGKYRVMEPQANDLECEGYGPEFIWNDVLGAFSGSNFDTVRPWEYTMNYPYSESPTVNVSGGGFDEKELWLDWAGWGEDMEIGVGDFNSDGKDDIAAVYCDASSREFIAIVLPSTGSGFQTPSESVPMTYPGSFKVMVGHLPSSDFIIVTEDVFAGGFRCVSGTRSHCPSDLDGYEVSSDASIALLGDPDGNGSINVIAFYQGSKEVKLRGIVWGDDFSPAGEIPYIGDFDGDGYDDAISFERNWGGVRVIRSVPDENKFTRFCLWHDEFCLGDEEPMVGDFNGDGRDDIISFDLDDGNVYVGLSTVFGFWSDGLEGTRALWQTDFCNNGDEPLVGDFNGDGLDDIAYFKLDGYRARVWVSLANPSTMNYDFHGGCLCGQANFYLDGYSPSICP